MAALGEMLAALANGPLTRKDKRNWSAADFMPERWKAAPAEPAKETSALDFMASLRGQRAPPVRKR